MGWWIEALALFLTESSPRLSALSLSLSPSAIIDRIGMYVCTRVRPVIARVRWRWGSMY